MLFRTHFVSAVFFYLLCFNFFDNKILLFLGIIFATLFVDIDSRKSKFGNHWFFRPLQWFLSHRGMIHSLVFCVLLSVVVFSFNNSIGVGFFIGYLLHLLLDLLTKQGVEVFWPFFGKIYFLPISSGGIIEEIIFVLVLLSDLFLSARIFL